MPGTAYFNGVNLFGFLEMMEAGVSNPPATQQSAYPGLDNIEEIRMGQRGRVTNCRGFLQAASIPALNAAEMLFRSYVDNRAYNLVDQFGNLWTQVKLEAFNVEGKVMIKVGQGLFYRNYTARFRHLSAT